MLSRELQYAKKEWKGGFAISKKLKHLERKYLACDVYKMSLQKEDKN